MTNIIAAMTNHTVTTIMMRPISTTLSCSGAEEEDLRPPPRLANPTMLARGDEFPMNSWPTSQNYVTRKFNFGEFTFSALR